MKLKKADILAIPHKQAFGFDRAKGVICTGVSSDSRSVKEGDVFFALHGERFDGHNFITKAIDAGCRVIVADAKWADANPILLTSLNIPLLIVEDTIRALGALASERRAAFKIPVVVIGGSNGKTTTKEMIASVLRTKYRVLSTEGNLNNQIGVPHVLFRLERAHRIAVIEIGTNHPGEIAYLCDVAAPTHALITNIGREHLEFFGTVEGVAGAEAESFAWLRAHRKARAVAFVNADDKRIVKKSKGVAKQVSFGFGKGRFNLRGKVVSLNDDACALLELIPRGKKPFRVQLGVPGLHSASNALAAAAVGLTFGISAAGIRNALESFTGTSKRMQVVRIGDLVVLNDTYNSNPDSVHAALGVLASMRVRGKKIAVLADMLELGPQSADEHRQIGRAVAASGAHMLFTFGPLSRHTHDESDVQQKIHFESKSRLCEHLLSLVGGGDVVLVKGSRGMKMEEIVSCLADRYKRDRTSPGQAA